MKFILSLLCLFIALAFTNCNHTDSMHDQHHESDHSTAQQKILPTTGDAVVLRTDFSNEMAWKEIQKEIRTPNPEFGFTANVLFNDEEIFDHFPSDSLKDITGQYMPSFIFVADHQALTNPSHPLLCVGLRHNAGKQFRVVTSDLWNVENNLSNANMDFNDFCSSTDANGIVRGME